MYDNITDIEIVEYIKKIVAIYLNVSEDTYNLRTRKHEILKVKQYACYFAKRHTALANEKLAKLFNFKNHSSVISLVKKIEGYATFDKTAKLELKEIENIIRLKGLSKNERVNFSKYYYINMNDFKSVRENPERAIVFIGYSNDEIIDLLKAQTEIREHSNTQKFIIEENQKETK